MLVRKTVERLRRKAVTSRPSVDPRKPRIRDTQKLYQWIHFVIG